MFTPRTYRCKHLIDTSDTAEDHASGLVPDGETGCPPVHATPPAAGRCTRDHESAAGTTDEAVMPASVSTELRRRRIPRRLASGYHVMWHQRHYLPGR